MTVDVSVLLGNAPGTIVAVFSDWPPNDRRIRHLRRWEQTEYLRGSE